MELEIALTSCNHYLKIVSSAFTESIMEEEEDDNADDSCISRKSNSRTFSMNMQPSYTIVPFFSFPWIL